MLAGFPDREEVEIPVVGIERTDREWPRAIPAHLQVAGVLEAIRQPERALVDDYLARADRTGRPLGLGPVMEHEVEDRKGGGMSAEGVLLAKTLKLPWVILTNKATPEGVFKQTSYSSITSGDKKMFLSSAQREKIEGKNNFR